MTNNKDASRIFTANECLAQSIPSTSSGSGSRMRTNCEERGGWKRKGKGGGGEAKRMKISEGCNSQQAEEMSSRMDPCQSLPPEIFRRILSSLSFISMRHAMLVS